MRREGKDLGQARGTHCTCTERAMRGHGEDGRLQAGEKGLRRSKPASTLTLHFQPLELGDNTFLLFKSVCGILL